MKIMSNELEKCIERKKIIKFSKAERNDENGGGIY